VAATASLRCALRGAALALVLMSPAFIAEASAQQSTSEELRRLHEAVAQQQEQINAQQRILDEQRALIDRLLREQERDLPVGRVANRREPERALPVADMADMRAADANAGTAPMLLAQDSAAEAGQVGEPPPERDPVLPERAAMPENASVLTPRGRFAFEPSFEYVNASTNRLVFRGIEIVVGLQIGVIEASDVDRDTLVGAGTLRYGLLDRLELELRAPFLYRHDRVLTLAQRDEQIIREIDIEGSGVGDIEAAVRYQFNSGRDGGPIYIGNLRYKSTTGTSPFEIDRDEFGILEELPTGSGFWGLEPSLTVLMPSDPVVLYGTLSYFYHAPDDIDREIGDVLIGEVDPGDSIGASVGFGFALNDRFSFSLGYKHNYIYETTTEFADTTQRSEPLQVGSLLLGMSYRLNDRATASMNFEFGATADAPNARMVFRVPFVF
jgi:hypothetical protein